MKHTYESVLKDWKYLFEYIDVAYDMTGGYVDQEDLHRMLMNPTKTEAKKCLLRQIVYWFEVGTDNHQKGGKNGKNYWNQQYKKDGNLRRIARKHDIELDIYDDIEEEYFTGGVK